MTEPKSVEGVGKSETTARARASEPYIHVRRQEELQARPDAEAVSPLVEPSAAFRPYRVMLDPETRRLFTEVIDTRTGNVLLRIPPGYRPAEDADATDTSQRREIEL